MGRLGFEPRTNRLKAEYSTIELATRDIIYLSHTIKQYNKNIKTWQQGKSEFLDKHLH